MRTALDTRCVLGSQSVVERLAEPAGVAPYHLVVAGKITLQVGNQSPIHLGAGDLVVLPRGQSHTIHSITEEPTNTPSEILCGQFRNGHNTSSSLLDILPDTILINASDDRRLSHFQALMQMLNDETHRDSGNTGITGLHLASALFSMLIDSWLKQDPEITGLLSLLSEPRILPALRKMLADLGASCNIDQMAQACHLSRTTFLRIFKRTSGNGPAEVLTQLRMAKAEQWLVRGEQSIGRIADSVGYQSESAFNKAFKRHCGSSPGEYRRAFRNKPY